MVARGGNSLPPLELRRIESPPPWRGGRRRRASLPEVSGIVFDTVLIQNGRVLGLEVHLAVVLLLVPDVRRDPLDVPGTDREGSVALLPREIRS